MLSTLFCFRMRAGTQKLEKRKDGFMIPQVSKQEVCSELFDASQMGYCFKQRI